MSLTGVNSKFVMKAVEVKFSIFSLLSDGFSFFEFLVTLIRHTFSLLSQDVSSSVTHTLFHKHRLVLKRKTVFVDMALKCLVVAK